MSEQNRTGGLKDRGEDLVDTQAKAAVIRHVAELQQSVLDIQLKGLKQAAFYRREPLNRSWKRAARWCKRLRSASRKE